MAAALTFCVVAALFGCLLRIVVVLRLRAARRRNASDPEMCSLRQASRITSVAVLVSLVGVAALAVVAVTW